MSTPITSSILRYCTRCGKPEHGSIACEYASPYSPPEPMVTVTTDHGFAVVAALERIATALEQLAAELAER